MDVITYIPNLVAFRDEARQKAEEGIKGFSLSEDNSVNYIVTKVPVHYSGNETLCVIRLINDEDVNVFDSLTSCVRLGLVNDDDSINFDDDESKITYERVRGSLSEEYKDGEGKTQIKTKPYLIGGFPS